jgi:hypothetical protein
LRSEIHSLHYRYRQQAHGLSDVSIVVAEQAGACVVCDVRMTVQKTVQHTGLTLAHGSFRSRETVYVCPSGCKREGKLVTARSSSLAKLLLPKSKVGYDVMVHIGRARFIHCRQRAEIRADLQMQYGITLSTGEISSLSQRFLVYLETLHWKSAPALRQALESDGGWPLHIDATGEDGRGTMVTAFAGWRGWVLHAWKASTERAEFILPGIQRVAASFGPPCAIMRDLGRAMTEAADEFVQSLKKPIPVLACHFHFLADVGEGLLEDGNRQLRDLFRNAKLLPQLRAFVRQQGRNLGKSIGPGRDALTLWLAQPDRFHPIPDGAGGITTVRSLAQWVLDYHADGAGLGFPFDLPWLDLYGRCLQLCAAIQTFLRQPPADTKVRKSLEKLSRILRPVECDVPPFVSIGESLCKRSELFNQLRSALQLEDKHVSAGVDPQHAVRKLNDIQSAVGKLTASLRKQRPQRGPAKDTRHAIDLILSHLDRHGPHLWGHAIEIPKRAGGGVRLVERTNNDLESLFHTIKHGERRRSGRKFLTHDFEVLPPTATLAANLRDPDYVHIVCGSLDGLAAAFAQLDAANRSRSIAAAPAPTTTIETASLSTLDKRFVRKPALGDRIMAAAQCL